MKKVLFSIAILAVAFGFTACSNEDEALGNVKGEKTTVLAMTEVGTRTALKDDGAGAYNVVWSEGDKIYINDNHSDGEEFTLKSGAGETTATFEGEVPADGDYYAFYGTKYTPFNSTQTYEAGKASNFPMIASATVKDGKISPIKFWNMGGILSLTVKGTATIKSIKVASNELMSGPTSVSINETGCSVSVAYGSKDVTLDCGTGVALTAEGTVFNITLIENNYTGVEITLTDADDNTLTKTFKGTDGLKIERSKITKASFTASFPPAGSRGTAKRTGDIDVNWIQLWEDGPKFAEYNVGVTDGKAESYGGYYCWGRSIDQEHPGTCNTGSVELTGADDTATNLWGSNWRMPTKEEFDKLLANCTAQWVTNYKNTGVKGRLFTGKGAYASNSIFFPATASCNDGTVLTGDWGNYWSSTPSTTIRSGKITANYLYSPGNRDAYTEPYDRTRGFSVRAVLNETPATTGSAKATIGGEDVDVKWVQLWKDGPKFAEYNVGATSANEYGCYYAWGGSQDKVDDHNTTITGEGNLTGTDDTATKLWGNNWRMPTKEEFENLLANCTCTWDGTNKGLLCTGKGDFSSNSVFLPAAGYCDGGDVIDLGSGGYYWSSTAYKTNGAHTLNFGSGDQAVRSCPNSFVYSVRAVLNETK